MDEKKLNLGCGDLTLEGYINLDIVKTKGSDIEHNLNEYPWPFQDNSFDEILALQIIEHVDDPTKFLEEIYRISKPGALVHIETPHHASGNAYGDISHKNYFSYQAFVNLDANRLQEMSNVEIQQKNFKFSLEKGRIELIRFKFLECIVNKFNKAYDYGLCYFIRPINIQVYLKVLK